MKTLTLLAMAVATAALPTLAHADTTPTKMTLNPADIDKPAAERRYCIKETFTGSRMPRNVCKTRAEWAAEGLKLSPRRG